MVTTRKTLKISIPQCEFSNLSTELTPRCPGRVPCSCRVVPCVFVTIGLQSHVVLIGQVKQYFAYESLYHQHGGFIDMTGPFQIFFMFTPKIGEDSHFDSYFFRWVETSNQNTMFKLFVHVFSYQITHLGEKKIVFSWNVKSHSAPSCGESHRFFNYWFNGGFGLW